MSNKEKFINKKIAVLCGGESGERDVSLRSGKKVYESLISQGFNAVILDPKDESFYKSINDEKIDIAFICLHGKFGEDGTIQGYLEAKDIPYTGSKILASALAMDKVASKRIWESQKIPTPKYEVIDNHKDLKSECDRIRNIFPFPLVLKPTSEGSSLGVSIIENKEKLFDIARETIEKFHNIFVEEFIDGRQVTVGILGVNGNTECLPILELKPKAVFYDYSAKYTAGMTEFIVPAKFPKLIYKEIQSTALMAHNCLNCRGVSRIDMIVDKDGIPYVHDANTIPGMTELSDLPAQANAAGISYNELVLKILESAL